MSDFSDPDRGKLLEFDPLSDATIRATFPETLPNDETTSFTLKVEHHAPRMKGATKGKPCQKR